MSSALTQLLLILLLPHPSGAVSGANEELKALEGKWTLIRVEMDGKKLADKEVSERKQSLVVRGKLLSICRDQKEIIRATMTIKADAHPKQMTLDATDLEGKGIQEIEAIYEIKGNVLRLYYSRPGWPRPTDFTPVLGTVLEVYERVDEKSGGPHSLDHLRPCNCSSSAAARPAWGEKRAWQRRLASLPRLP